MPALHVPGQGMMLAGHCQLAQLTCWPQHTTPSISNSTPARQQRQRAHRSASVALALSLQRSAGSSAHSLAVIVLWNSWQAQTLHVLNCCSCKYLQDSGSAGRGILGILGSPAGPHLCNC
jgi:hypothetical protein